MRLGASYLRSFPPTLCPEAQPWERSQPHSERQGRGWGLGDEEPAGEDRRWTARKRGHPTSMEQGHYRAVRGEHEAGGH